MSEKVEFVINGKIEIEMEDGYYKSNIQDITEEYVAISIPVNNGQYLPLRKEEKITGVYYYDKEIYRFKTVVLGRKIDKILIIMIKKPDTFKKLQRRNFVRVPFMTNICCAQIKLTKDIKSIGDNQIKFFEACSLDISGGGMRLAVDRSLKEKIHCDDILMITIPLGQESITVKTKIVRVESDRKNPKIIYGTIFFDLDKYSRETIIKLVFHIMRNQIKNGAKEE
ncbi:flagellar protein [Clostridium sp. P21]|uniref:Flagellar protein n=1 Tax=Clostridium muellerianum TaxID=2716538 RepID=A0A7Y0EDI6_9CLOT|nr:flagellar brake domain-containing protein [Clostridium muellerianum]NMM61438.1 flagellar protein [Clostridium muellerianum]